MPSFLFRYALVILILYDSIDSHIVSDHKTLKANLEHSPQPIRYSTRSIKKTQQFDYKACHNCHNLDTVENLIFCKNEICKLPFCLKCLKKYEVAEKI